MSKGTDKKPKVQASNGGVIPIKLVVFDSLPCATDKFIINGVVADKDDFGEAYDAGNDDSVVCANKSFEPFKNPPDGVLEKYSIDWTEFRRIGDELESSLHVGRCNWCW